MRAVDGDFNRLDMTPGLGFTVFLGTQSRHPELATLTPGERILIVEPGQVWAEGTAQVIEERGERWWYGVLEEGREAIHAVVPGHPAPAEAQAKA
jgi:hypothetical protein